MLKIDDSPTNNLEPLVWSTVRVTVNTLRGFDKNPRKITEREKKRLQDSLEKFNLVEIPVINLDYTIVSGHQRIDALYSLGRGEEEIDVRAPNRSLTEDELKQYNIIANRHNGVFDIDKLNIHFGKEMLLDIGFKENELLSPDEQKKKRHENTEENFVLPEMELKAFEHHDFMVVVFDNSDDFLKAVTMFGLGKVEASFTAKRRRIGIGRIVKGQDFFERIG